MDSDSQSLAAVAVVVLTLVSFLLRAWKLPGQGGCGGCGPACNLPPRGLRKGGRAVGDKQERPARVNAR